MECKNWFVSVIRITVEACPFISLKQLGYLMCVWGETVKAASVFKFEHEILPFPQLSKQLDGVNRQR